MSQYGKSIAQYQLLMEIEVKKHCHTIVWLSLQCRCRIWASKRYKLAIVYPTGHVWLELEWTTRVEGGEGREVNFTPPPPPPPISLFLSSTAPLVQIYFPPQTSASIKIKDGGYNFREENTEHTLAKITPTQQASMTLNWLVVIHSYVAISFRLSNKGKERRHNYHSTVTNIIWIKRNNT